MADNTSESKAWPKRKVDSFLGRVMNSIWQFDVGKMFENLDKVHFDMESDSRTKGGGTAQRTYLMNRKKQKEEFLKDGYIEGTPGDYGLVQKAVGDRDLPVYQTHPDAIDRKYLVPILNLDTQQRISNNTRLFHAGHHPSTVYVDGRDGETMYQKAWDLNDYGGHGGGASSKYGAVAKWFADLLDYYGKPTVVTTGYQHAFYDPLLQKEWLAEHGLSHYMGSDPETNQIFSYIALPEVVVTPDKKVNYLNYFK